MCALILVAAGDSQIENAMIFTGMLMIELILTGKTRSWPGI